jgi:2-polyprenyl-6-methoxyphenol hydroxylase-like FAD-dependent oxidoreductase
MSRQAAAYRKGRVLLAGDAAHVHSPVGGQGLNTGVQDAVNLGWKLAQVVKGTSPESLLDSYRVERHPVAARVLRTTMAQVAMQRTDDRTEALRDIVSELLGMEEARKRIAAGVLDSRAARQLKELRQSQSRSCTAPPIRRRVRGLLSYLRTQSAPTCAHAPRVRHAHSSLVPS